LSANSIKKAQFFAEIKRCRALVKQKAKTILQKNWFLGTKMQRELSMPREENFFKTADCMAEHAELQINNN
jgi:hypothetical protein